MCHIPSEPVKSVDYFDIIYKAATVVIAFFNAYFAVKIFTVKDKKDAADKERDRKIQLLKTLVLDHNLKYFYESFDKIDLELIKLKQPNLTDLEKQAIDEMVAGLFIFLRQKFYDSLLAIDEGLYDGIIEKADKLQADLSDAIFDPGINLSHIPKYEELINEKLSLAKTEIIKNLFAYRG